MSAQMDLIKRLSVFRANDNYCDVDLVVEGRSFRAHRVVLAAVSDYFHSMFEWSFREKSQDRVELKNMTLPVFESFMNYVYEKPEFELTEETALLMLDLAELTMSKPLRKYCVSFLIDNVSTYSNCIVVYKAARLYEIDALVSRSMAAIAQRFDDDTVQDDMKRLSKDEFTHVFTSKEFKEGATELEMYKAAFSWMEQNPSLWETPMELMKHVDFKRMHPTKVNRVASSVFVQQHPDFAYHLLQENVAVRSLPAAKQHSRTLVALSHDEEMLICLHDAQLGKEVTTRKFTSIELGSEFKRAGSCAVIGVDDELFVFGGTGEHESLDMSVSIDVTKNIWRKKPPMPSVGSEGAIFVLHKKYIFVVGGREAGPYVHGHVLRYNIEESSWKSMRDLPDDICSAAACVCKGSAYLTGGENDNIVSADTMDTIYLYREETDDWIVQPKRMLNARSGHDVCSVDTTLYIAFGNYNLDTIETYNTVTHAQSILATPDGIEWPLCFTAFDEECHLYALQYRSEGTENVANINWTLVKHNLVGGSGPTSSIPLSKKLTACGYSLTQYLFNAITLVDVINC